jgi:glycerol-3-phosphate dehydrogenase
VAGDQGGARKGSLAVRLTMTEVFDILVVGGGVNGCGIARDAAGRGFSVLLAERGDIGGATSSASSKLIHGGLRYLEHREFRLVREALAEREVLLRIAPHIIRPMRFVLPHRPEMRPRWVIRAGLFLYDHLARRVSLPGAESFSTRDDPRAAPLRPEITAAFAYSDAWVEDSRLVVLNARDAARRGARVLVRTALVSAKRGADAWNCTLRSAEGAEQEVRARVLVNAAGPWAEQALGIAGVRAAGRVRLVRGSHVVLPALYEGEHAFILQNDDGRVVFVIPYEGAFSLVGTTDVPHEGDPAEARCTDEEAAYLCAAVGRQFHREPRPEEIVWRYSGVRPLRDDGAGDPSAVSRDYSLSLDRGEGAAPALSVFGGKITTYRRLAEEAMDRLGGILGGARTPWTGTAPLPGGDLGGLSLPAFERAMAKRHPWLPPPVLRRLARSYGSELEALLGGAKSLADLGQDLGGGLTERELEWLRSEEWARTADDVLWRRTRLGLHLSAAQRDAVEERFQA